MRFLTYRTLSSRPMDLLKMEEKLENDEYLRYSDFRNDFKLIVNNCRLYNGHNNGSSVGVGNEFSHSLTFPLSFQSTRKW